MRSEQLSMKAWPRPPWLRVAALLVVGVSFAACSGAHGIDGPGGGPTRSLKEGPAATIRAAREFAQRTDAYYATQADLPSLLSLSVAAVELRVDSVEGPFFNSPDGSSWTGTNDVSPQVFSWVHTTVTKQVAGADVPKSIDILTLGDARIVYDGDAGQRPFDAISGGFVPGEIYLVTLGEGKATFGEKSTPAWVLEGDYQGNWHIENSEAVSGDSRFSGPVDKIEQAMKSDEGSMVKPSAEYPPPPAQPVQALQAS